MSIIIMILLISMLIVVHEIGHFLAAKAFGIAVPKFGFGLPVGPTLYKKKIGETEVLVHALLLGGYVAFLDDEEHPEVPKDSPLRFQNKPVWQRAIVVSAGVIANVVTAVVLVMFVAASLQYLPAREKNVYINRIIANANAPIHSIGIKAKDQLYTINGTKVISELFLSQFAKGSSKFNGVVEKSRVEAKKEALKQLNPSLADTEIIPAGTDIKLPEFDNEKPVEFSTNYLLGIDRENSKMKTVNLTDKQKELRNLLYNKKSFTLEEETTLDDIATAISDTSAPIMLTVKRGEEIIELKPLFVDESGIIGVECYGQSLKRETKNLKSIFVESVRYLFETTYLMLLGLVKLFSGQVPFKDLHGIVVITKIGSDVISHAGIFEGLILTAMISLNLAIMNFLPIPALDGGHLLFLIFEKIKGKPLNEKVLEKISSVCFILLLVLMCFILYNDIFALVTKKFG